jgi:hypothetical protein
MEGLMDLDAFRKEEYLLFTPDDQALLDEYLQECLEEPIAEIVWTDELIDELYVVIFKDWSDFWLGAFKSRAEALEFCSKYGIMVEEPYS